MIEKKEILNIALGIVLFILLLMFQDNTINWSYGLNAFIIATSIILISFFAKKITAYKLDTKIEVKILEFRRYWITKNSEFKYAVPLGLLLPLIMSFLSYGFLRFLTIFQFEAEALPSKVGKRYGVRRFSSVLEWDYALIIFYSTLSLLIFGVLCKYFAFLGVLPFKEMAHYSVFYVLWNMIPFGQIDGMKLYMGSRPLYITTWIIILATGLVVFI